MTKVGLVLEGGAMRGMYTAGVLDVLMENDIKVDGIIGVSAGALFGPNFFSRQKGRVIRYNKRFCKDYRYMSLLNFFLTGNVINKKFAFYDVTTKYDVFDNETFIKNNTGYYVVATNVETGKAEYFKVKDILKDMEMLRASSAIPLFSKLIEVNNKKYLDGGISDSIPIDECKKLGYDKIIVVLTRPFDYRKEPLSGKKIQLISKKYRKFPRLIETMKNRHNNYNNTIEKIIDLEMKNEIFVMRPSESINIKIIERHPDNLQKVYDLGVSDCKNQIKKLKEYLKEKNSQS